MYLIKRKRTDPFIYAYEPTDQVMIINKPARYNTSYKQNDIVTVKQGRPRPMPRINIKAHAYLVQGNKPTDYPLQVAGFEITPAVPPTKEEYAVMVTEWSKNQMIELLLQGAGNAITD
jgi:hypothetical protein